jgi:hypothetical protein
VLQLVNVVYTAAACLSQDSLHIRPSASLQLTATSELVKLLIDRAGPYADYIAGRYADCVAGRFAGHIAGRFAGHIAGQSAG